MNKNIKFYINMIILVIKIFVKSFGLNITDYLDYLLYENSNLEKKNMWGSILIITFPIRLAVYGWLCFKASENNMGDANIDTIIGVITIIEIIDKSIMESIDEIIQEEDNNNKDLTSLTTSSNDTIKKDDADIENKKDEE